MAYQFTHWTARSREVGEHLAKELAGLRSGRAALSALDGVLVESYGSRQPVKHLAAISLEGPRTLRIVPFDLSFGKEIEKALSLANLGVSVAADEGGIRVHFPELTGERRALLIKTAKEKLEHSRIALRRARDEVQKDIEAKEKEKAIGEDERFRLKKELDKLSHSEDQKLEEQCARKEREIMT